MKRLLALLAVTISLTASAQKAAVQTAYNYLRYDDLDKAKEAIDGAVVNESTMGMSKAWYYRALIYHALHESQKEKFAPLKPGSLAEARKSYEKTMELDTKNEYKDDIMKRMEILASQSLNGGVDFYKDGKYADAMKMFQASADINKKYFNRLDTLALYNAGLAADKSGDINTALNNFKALTEVNYGGSRLYSMMANMYLDQKDTANALLTINQGRQKYPEDKSLITQGLNVYLSSGKYKEAYAQNEDALKNDPNNPILYYIKGTLADRFHQMIDKYNKIDNGMTIAEVNEALNEVGSEFQTNGAGANKVQLFSYSNSGLNVSFTNGKLSSKGKIDLTDSNSDYKNIAISAYKKALELNNEYFDAAYNLGAMYFNEGAELSNKANKIPANKVAEYDLAKKQFMKKFEESEPYLEKAYSLNRGDVSTIQSLKQISLRLNNAEKANYYRLALDHFTKGNLASGTIQDVKIDMWDFQAFSLLGKPNKETIQKEGEQKFIQWIYPKFSVIFINNKVSKVVEQQ